MIDWLGYKLRDTIQRVKRIFGWILVFLIFLWAFVWLCSLISSPMGDFPSIPQK